VSFERFEKFFHCRVNAKNSTLQKFTTSIKISPFTGTPDVFYIQLYQILRIDDKNGIKREILHVKYELEPQRERKL